MAADNRDWYRDWWRKKTGYVERASFRVSDAEFGRAKDRLQVRRLVVYAVLVVLLLVVAKQVIRHLRMTS